MNIENLALKFRLLTQEQYDEVVSFKASSSGASYSMDEILQKFGFLSTEKIKFLNKLKHHLTIQGLDNRFGIIAQSQFNITNDAIKDALKTQTEEFRKQKKTQLIGDILIQKGVMTREQRDFILKKQNRLKKKLLDNITDKRFGAIAVTNNYATIDQINNALKIQSNHFKQTGEKKSIGSILVEKGDISKEHRDTIVQEQKQITKLQRALEFELYKKFDVIFHLEISADRMLADLTIKGTLPETTTFNHVYSWLKKQKIIYGINEDNIQSLIHQEHPQGKKVTIASGSHPTTGKDVFIEFFFHVRNLSLLKQVQLPSKQSKPFYRFPEYRGVERFLKDDRLATKTPSRPGLKGRDVLGKFIDPPLPSILRFGAAMGFIRKMEIFMPKKTAPPRSLPKVF